MQQEPSEGQSASRLILSQNNAKSPFTHSPLQGIFGLGLVGLIVVVVVMVVV